MGSLDRMNLCQASSRRWSADAKLPSESDHIPREQRDLLRSKPNFDREQEDREVACGIAGLLEKSSPVCYLNRTTASATMNVAATTSTITTNTLLLRLRRA